MANSSLHRTVGRPDMPDGYGLAPLSAEEDQQAWDAAQEKLRSAHNYWIGSTRPDGRPHAMPVWGLWWEEAFYFSTDPGSRKGRNMAAQPEVVVHLESGDEVVILEGRVGIEQDARVLEALDQEYYQKYQFHLTGSEAPDGSVYRLKPRTVFAWLEKNFPESALRWRFKEA
jgi:general stress protein 26